MAVKNDGAVHPTDTIISKNNRKHFKVSVSSQHWQLRSLISTQQDGLVYFPGAEGTKQIQRLNVETHEHEVIKLLCFTPRCLAAKNNWLCCGSETGDFVAFRTDEGNGNAPAAAPNYEVARRLARDLDLPLDDTLLSLLSLPGMLRADKEAARGEKLADDRINCVTMWFPQDTTPLCEGAYKEPIAVLANNDQTVRLVALSAFERKDKIESLEVIQYPDYVNRAIISPDGNLLIAVLDDPYLYVHKREVKEHAKGSQSDPIQYQWELFQRVLLKSQKKNDKSDNRGSFAACFSASGAYLAVGTQHGTISIFDVSLLTDLGASPLITTFESSRPESPPGAVRDMEFCPGPYDILAWTEDRGHVGLADIRTGFKSQQIIDINDTNFQHFNVPEHHVGHEENLSADDASGRERRRQRLLDHLRETQPMPDSDLQVLEAISNDRRRDRERGLRFAGQTSRDTNSSSHPARTTSTTAPAPWSNGARGYSRHATINPTDAGNSRSTHDRYRSFRAALREDIDRPPSLRRPQQQRLIDSIVESVEAMRDSRDRGDGAYLNLLEIIQGREPATESDNPGTISLVDRVVSHWEDSAIRGTLPSALRETGGLEQTVLLDGSPPAPDTTAGLSWSEDGCKLFVGAQNGIYELHVNIQGRKLCPSVVMR